VKNLHRPLHRPWSSKKWKTSVEPVIRYLLQNLGNSAAVSTTIFSFINSLSVSSHTYRYSVCSKQQTKIKQLNLKICVSLGREDKRLFEQKNCVTSIQLYPLLSYQLSNSPSRLHNFIKQWIMLCSLFFLFIFSNRSPNRNLTINLIARLSSLSSLKPL